MTTFLVVLLIVAFVLASEALRERRHDRHWVERRVVTYAGQHDSRIIYRLDAIRRDHANAARARFVAGGRSTLGHPISRIAVTVRA